MNNRLTKMRVETTSAHSVGVVGMGTWCHAERSASILPGCEARSRSMSTSSKNTEVTTDSALVAAALNDLDQFEKIVERYEAPLLGYIQRISSFSKEEAQDVLQEVFVKCWRNLNGYQPNLPFKSWIYRIAHNAVISAFRKHKSRGYDAQIELDPSLYDSLPSNELGIDEEINKKQRAELVRSVLDMMTLKEREVLVLRYFENQDYDSISDILKKPIGTISTLLHRAKKSFKECWERLSSSYQLS